MPKSQLLELILAIRAVESANGLLSNNELQITQICVDDVNRLYGTYYTMCDAFDKRRSEEIAVLYLSYWAWKSKQPMTAELYARIWNGGPNGWKKQCTLKYWHKVKRELEKLKTAHRHLYHT